VIASNIGTKLHYPAVICRCAYYRNDGAYRTMKWLSGTAAGILAILSSAPQLIRDAVIVTVVFILMDTFTGFVRACLEGRARSRSLLRGVTAKAVQYVLLFTLFGGAAILSRNVYMNLGAFGIIIGVESVSIIENLYAMEKVGGVKLPRWARSLVGRVGKYLAVASEMPSLPNEKDDKLKQQ
jgi:phage-related holin